MSPIVSRFLSHSQRLKRLSLFKATALLFTRPAGALLSTTASHKSVAELYEQLPSELCQKLHPNLRYSQVKGVLRMHLAGREPPEHMLAADPRTRLHKQGCHPHLSAALRKKGGRNHHGHITIRHRGGGFKRRIRILDNHGAASGPHEVIRLEHDPNRGAKLALVRNQQTQMLSYRIAWDGAAVGQVVENDREQAVGCAMMLSKIALGSVIHNIELRPGDGGQMARSAGCKAVLVARHPESTLATIRLPSGRQVKVSQRCRATIGSVGNKEWHLRVIGSAGRNRNLGWRPTVRGVAMNPVDHPHGGGSGGRNKGHHSQSPWGKICK